MSLVDEPVAASLEQFGYKQELKRALSLRDLLIYGLVLIVPAAPFGVYGIVFNAAHGMVPLVYLIGLVAMLFTAMSYQALSEAFPVAGSAYAFAARGIGSEAGFIAGWAILLDYIIVPTLCYVVAAIAFAALVPEIPRPVWIVVMLGFATAVNYFGVDLTARINFILLGLQSAVLAILVGFCFLGRAASHRRRALVVSAVLQPARADAGPRLRRDLARGAELPRLRCDLDAV